MNFYKDVIQIKSVITDFETESDTLWVLFAGIRGGLGVKILEFGDITKNFPIKKMFVRDLNTMYFYKGIYEEDAVNDILDMKKYLSQKLIESGAKKIAFIGNSAGGYASLLFGKLLNVDEVHAFAPPTFLDRENRILHNDNNLTEIYDRLHNEIESNLFFDLVDVFNTHKNQIEGSYNIYYDQNSRIDKLHAERMGIFKEINLHPFPEGGHLVIKELKESGILTEILTNCYDRLSRN
ncbi:hypothetical protein [Bacillus thuringiensis]|uniref:Alpha/beta hydrolase n=1 Tax=Bacillus thuringiensis TaxID=1428 RepID=A0AB36TMB5_BACTU|nr:hypothetical protein [Bacillus thuringiensis]PEE61142.1 hypothetical protein COM74_31320 [Bacillus thuringiensis]PEE90417.1 hypothetical protein COM90_02150 [Bacillus thuringiensis]PFM84978.1 hypothetical protein COJ61_28615 [Bacillus thuringiensis]PGK36017.1 hypothetical protein CN908_23300 [Bacillus thuringiensis]WIG15503.1 hypothetical protein QOM09_28010 [Bacillus thuringiensis]